MLEPSLPSNNPFVEELSEILSGLLELFAQGVLLAADLSKKALPVLLTLAIMTRVLSTALEVEIDWLQRLLIWLSALAAILAFGGGLLASALLRLAS